MPVDVETKVALVTAALAVRTLRARRLLSDADCHGIVADIAGVLPARDNPDVDAPIDLVEKLIFSSPDGGQDEPALV